MCLKNKNTDLPVDSFGEAGVLTKIAGIKKTPVKNGRRYYGGFFIINNGVWSGFSK